MRMTELDLIILSGVFSGKMKIPQAKPILAKKKRGARSTNRRKVR